MAIYYYHNFTNVTKKSVKFTSQYYINLGSDVDNIINTYIEQLDKICDCESCKCFGMIFDNYYRKKSIV